jgi:GNAT superfamily N-acetyltransferase
MTIDFREGNVRDRDAILALRAISFAGDDPEKQQPDFWQWEFVDGYAGAARFFVAESDDRVVGHFAVVPQQYQFRKAVRGGLIVDVMIDPAFRRQRVFSRLASFVASTVRNDFQVITAFQIREAVKSGIASAGWTAVDQVPVLLRPVSLVGIARDFLFRNSEPAGSPVAAAGTPALLHDFETIAVRQPRTPEFVKWRYFSNPHWRYSFEGDDRAYVVHRDSVLRGLRSIAIVDAGGDPDRIRQLIRTICRRRSDRAVAAALLSRSHPAYRALRRSGFFPGPHRFNLLLNVFDDSIRGLYEEPWSLSWGDTDHV